MEIVTHDRVIREMLKECFGEGYKVDEHCIMVYFGSIVEEMKGLGAILIPGLGAFRPMFVKTLVLNSRGMLGVRDIDGIKRGAVKELKGSGRDEGYISHMIEKYKLKEYEDK